MLTLAAAAAFTVLAAAASEAGCAVGAGQCAAGADHSLIQSKSLINSFKKLAVEELEVEGQKTDGDKEESAQGDQEGGLRARKAEAWAKLQANKHAKEDQEGGLRTKKAGARAKLQARKDAQVAARKALVANKKAKRQRAKAKKAEAKAKLQAKKNPEQEEAVKEYHNAMDYEGAEEAEAAQGELDSQVETAEEAEQLQLEEKETDGGADPRKTEAEAAAREEQYQEAEAEAAETTEAEAAAREEQYQAEQLRGWRQKYHDYGQDYDSDIAEVADRMSKCERAAILVEGKISDMAELRYRRATTTWYQLLTQMQGYGATCVAYLHAEEQSQGGHEHYPCFAGDGGLGDINCLHSSPTVLLLLAASLNGISTTNIQHLLLVFTDHGGREGELIFDNKGGKPQTLPREDTQNIVGKLHTLKSDPKLLIYLMACYSGRVFLRPDTTLSSRVPEKWERNAKAIGTRNDYQQQELSDSDELVTICKTRSTDVDGHCRAFTAAVPSTTSRSLKSSWTSSTGDQAAIVDLFYVVVMRSIINLAGTAESVGRHAVDIQKMDGFNRARLTMDGSTPVWKKYKPAENRENNKFNKMAGESGKDILEYKDVSTGLTMALDRDVANLAMPTSFGNMHLEDLAKWFPKRMDKWSCSVLFGSATMEQWAGHGFDICTF